MDWTLEVRSVNARGLDVRIRLPEGLDALEPVLRGALQKALSRGSVQVGLRLSAAEASGATAVNMEAVDGLLDAAAAIAAAADAKGVAYRPFSTGEILLNRAVMEQGRNEGRLAGVAEAVAAAVPDLVAELQASRAREGAALAVVMSGHLDRIAALVSDAEAALGDRKAAREAQLRERVGILLGAQDRVDEDRLAQELALIAVKADVSEEIDRLTAHVGNARGLVGSDGAVGRKLDFLTQEFNREANTLCSKSQDAALTEIGLELKVIIDQMREQAANIE